ncbi:MAG: MMPL family transporter [Candidatus Thalassarchaeaceae archaeon]|jgi:predicted RND superfamily exporter protein|nr:MMPL family transporter [Euryarchaeota archaeon]MDG1542600.1 MMPL family transporter [Candidatus Thalassarchaeaceae archaeon]|tara:strand:- start:1879 stop:4437 length:2559 start_codon:yes stop_codon:yes gene_type:complete
MMGADSREERFAETFSRLAPAILFVSLLLTVITASALLPLPEFTTDLSSFAPENDAKEAEERMDLVMTSTPNRIYVQVNPNEEGANILEIGALQQMGNDLENINLIFGEDIISHINIANILDNILKERDNESRTIQDFEEWGDLLTTIINDDEKCTDAIGNDQAIASATFARDALLNKDFDYLRVCDWIEGQGGSSTPVASSAMWVIEVNGGLDTKERQDLSKAIREYLSENVSGNENSVINYGVISDDLISNDINDTTLDNFTWLLLLAIIVVVFVLSIVFRSFLMIAAPLLGLSAALIWTYGTITLLGRPFSILEVAVAPVVFGLGIDYAIHLQRGYEEAKENTSSAAHAWIKSFSIIRVALTLAVITTVSAFLASSLSPLPPLRTFGITLALGVICAFIASTVTVGALHVVVEKTTGVKKRRKVNVSEFANIATRIQQRNTARILLVVVLLTTSSVFLAGTKLDTSFELTDFLSEDDMPIMEVRSDIYDSYDAAAWKSVTILIEPNQGEESLTGERDILRGLEFLDLRISAIPDVVTPINTNSQRPSYDGLYPILRDAVEMDSTFGDSYHLGIFDGELDVIDGFEEGDVSSAIHSLLLNDSIGEPLRGQTWAERTSMHVALTEDNSSLRYLKIRVDVIAETSEQTSNLAEEFEKQANQLEEDGYIDAEVHIGGEVMMIHSIFSGLVVSQVESTGVSLLVSIFVLFVLTRRLGQSLVVILPVGIAGSWVVGSMAILGLNWNVLTIMITALTVGLGIDYSIHVWRSFEANRNSGLGVWDSMRNMYATTGTALIMSACTTICGFLVLKLSPIPVIQDFGIVSSISVAFSLILALFVLPGLLAAEVKTSNLDN